MIDSPLIDPTDKYVETISSEGGRSLLIARLKGQRRVCVYSLFGLLVLYIWACIEFDEDFTTLLLLGCVLFSWVNITRIDCDLKIAKTLNVLLNRGSSVEE